MSKTDTGGNAFPIPGVWDGDRNTVNPVDAYYDSGGMTLRDYFAAKAMQGMLSGDRYFNVDSDKIAAWAYQQADAMLKAREA